MVSIFELQQCASKSSSCQLTFTAGSAHIVWHSVAFPIGATLCSDSLLRVQGSYVCGAAAAYPTPMILKCTYVSSGPNIRRSVSSLLSGSGCKENTSGDSEFNASRRPSERRLLGTLDSSLAESDATAQLKHYRITGHVETLRAASA